jgi:putative restriction endonuclease
MTTEALEHYQKAFAKLKRDKAQPWGENTTGGAPHKPFLLLAIMDLIADGQIRQNVVEITPELGDIFDLYWNKVIGQEKRGTLLLPFFHLHSDTFWHLVAVSGQEQVVRATRSIRSFSQMKELVAGATFDEALFELLKEAESRDALRKVLIEHYFHPDTRPVLVEVGNITAQSFEYSRELLQRLRGEFVLEEAPQLDDVYTSESRSRGFRQIIVKAYASTCAVCRTRIFTPAGHTAVAAAHIVPWSVSHNDDPRNGMALCGLHHWAFDYGLFTVSTNYQIVISPYVPENEHTRLLRDLHQHALYLPDDEEIYPASVALEWHRKNVYVRE